MARIIAIADNKGGVAKTTTAGTLAYGSAALLTANGDGDGKVLVVDLDSQGNQADFFGIRDRLFDPVNNPQGACISHVLNEENCDVHEFVVSVD